MILITDHIVNQMIVRGLIIWVIHSTVRKFLDIREHSIHYMVTVKVNIRHIIVIRGLKWRNCITLLWYMMVEMTLVAAVEELLVNCSLTVHTRLVLLLLLLHNWVRAIFGRHLRRKLLRLLLDLLLSLLKLLLILLLVLSFNIANRLQLVRDHANVILIGCCLCEPLL